MLARNRATADPSHWDGVLAPLPPLDVALRDLAPWVQRLSQGRRQAIADLLSTIAARLLAPEAGGGRIASPPALCQRGHSVETAPLQA